MNCLPLAVRSPLLSKSDSRVALASVVYRNVPETERVVHLRLRRLDDSDRGFEIVYDERVTMAGKSIEIIEPDWPAEPYKWELLYTTQDKLRMLEIPEEVFGVNEGGCNHLMASYAEPEGLMIWVADELPIGDYRDELPSC